MANGCLYVCAHHGYINEDASGGDLDDCYDCWSIRRARFWDRCEEKRLDPVEVLEWIKRETTK